MRTLSASEIQSRCVDQLGLDSIALDMGTPEALAALLRRIGAFACPCPPSQLVSTAVKLLAPLNCLTDIREAVTDSLEGLTAYGDFTESEDISGSSKSRLIYVSPPAFVELSPKLFLLVGEGVDGIYPLPEELKRRVDLFAHCRRLNVDDLRGTVDLLLQAGFIALRAESWLKAPPVLSASAHVQLYNSLLNTAGPVGTLDEFMLLDTERSPAYYPGRWTMPKRHTGRFVGRRPQAYGADLWCYMELADGTVKRLLDLPTQENQWRPYDEAWHLQQAIDAHSGNPQRYRCRQGPSASVIFDFFSPVPRWARRRWDAVGRETPPSKCLLAYVFSDQHFESESKFAQERMWLQQI